MAHIVPVLDQENRAAPWLSLWGWRVAHGRLALVHSSCQCQNRSWRGPLLGPEADRAMLDFLSYAVTRGVWSRYGTLRGRLRAR
jgi:hypothetical protein